MKRIIIILTVLTLALSACSSGGTKIGRGLDKGTSKIPTSKPPTTAPPRTKPPTKTAAPTVKPPTGYKGRTYTVVIRDTSGYNPVDLRLYVGDIIVFKNLDPNLEHSYSEDKGAWNSGKLKTGQTWTYKVTAAPGVYHVHDEAVGYIIGGPIEVIKTPTS